MAPPRLRARLSVARRLGGSDYARQDGEFYFTEPRCTAALLRHVKLPRGVIWEPACGEGHIVRVLEARGHRVHASDLVDRGVLKAGRHVRYGLDFLTMAESSRPAGLRVIITNPPFGQQGKLAAAFIRRALQLVPPDDGMVVMFLPHDFDCGVTRLELLEVEPFCLKVTMMFRPNLVADRRAGGRNNFDWYVWDRAHVGPRPLIRYAA